MILSYLPNISSKRYLTISVSLYIIVLLLALLPSYFSIFSYVILSVFFIFNYKYAPAVFLILSFLILANESLFQDVSDYSWMKYFLFFIFFIQTFMRLKKDIINNYFIIMLLFIFILIFFHSIFFSYYFIFSFLKLSLWFFFIFSFFLYFLQRTENEKNSIFNSLIGILVVSIFLSVPLFFIPSIGFSLNETGFQGITNQPQVFGSIVGLLSICLFISLFKINKLYLLFPLIISIIFLIFSQSRAAGLALFISIIVLFFQVLFKNFLNISKYYSNKANFYLFSSLLLLPSLVIMNLQYIINFINKRDESGITSLKDSSRGGLIEKMSININNFPLEGIGFGIPSDFDFNDGLYMPFFDIPISLPSEKGVFYIALIEEMGFVFGGIVFLIVLMVFFKRIKTNIYAPIIFFILTCNVAENTFFSIGGLGMVFWIMLCLSLNYKLKEIS